MGENRTGGSSEPRVARMTARTEGYCNGADLSGYARASLRLRTATQALTGEAEIPHCSTSAIQRFRSVMSLCMSAQKRAADKFIAQECHLLSHAASLPATVERFRIQLCRPLCGQGLRRRNDLNTVAPMPTWWKGLSYITEQIHVDG